MTFLSLSYNILQWIAIFPLQNESKWTLCAFNVYRILIFFFIVGSITILMNIQMVIATDLTIIARTIEIWIFLLSGLYKWYCMTAYNENVSKLRMTLVQIKAQETVTYSVPANLFTDNYLKSTRKITLWYLFSGVIAVFLTIVNPLLSHPKR